MWKTLLQFSYDLLGAFKEKLKKKVILYSPPLWDIDNIWPIAFKTEWLKKKKKHSLYDKTWRQKRECKSFLYYIYVAPFGKIKYYIFSSPYCRTKTEQYYEILQGFISTRLLCPVF